MPYAIEASKGSHPQTQLTFQVGHIMLLGKLPDVGVYWDGLLLVQGEQADAGSDLQADERQCRCPCSKMHWGVISVCSTLRQPRC